MKINTTKNTLRNILCCAFCAIFAILSVVTGFAFSNQGGGEKQFSTPVFRMAVASDLHIAREYDGGANDAKFIKMFDSAYAYADKQEYSSLDAVVVTGDLTHVASEIEMKTLQQIVQQKLRRETEFLSILGNHDISSAYQDWVYTELDRHLEVKGFHLIGLSNDDSNGNYTQEQFDWLSKQLADATLADQNKPVFVFQHQHIKDSVEGSGTNFNVVKVKGETYETATKFDDLFSNYSQVIHFSGHSHTPPMSPLSIHQDGYTMIDVGSSFSSHGYSLKESKKFSSFSGITQWDNLVNGGLPNSKNASNMFRIVEVDQNNLIRVLTYDLKTEAFVKTPSTTDAADALLSFNIDISNPTTYTDARKDAATSPYFESGDSIAVVPASTSAVISFEQAEDSQCMCAYKVLVSSEDGQELSFNFIDDFYYPTLAGSNESFTISGLTAGTTYSVSVIPVNIWGKTGSALSASFTTALE